MDEDPVEAIERRAVGGHIREGKGRLAMRLQFTRESPESRPAGKSQACHCPGGAVEQPECQTATDGAALKALLPKVICLLRQCRTICEEGMAMNDSSPQVKLDAAHYRKRAQQSRALAEEISDAAIQKQLLDISDTYARIAERIEGWDRDSPEG